MKKKIYKIYIISNIGTLFIGFSHARSEKSALKRVIKRSSRHSLNLTKKSNHHIITAKYLEICIIAIA